MTPGNRLDLHASAISTDACGVERVRPALTVNLLGPSVFCNAVEGEAGCTLTAERSATGCYRTTPLRALWQHPPYFHDGSAETLDAVVSTTMLT